MWCFHARNCTLRFSLEGFLSGFNGTTCRSDAHFSTDALLPKRPILSPYSTPIASTRARLRVARKYHLDERADAGTPLTHCQWAAEEGPLSCYEGKVGDTKPERDR